MENQMTVIERMLWVLFGLVVILLLAGISYFATMDAPKRGFTGLQVFFLRVAGVIFFPASLVIYFIFRPSIRQ
jgi:uncharacterized membrane protein